MGLVDICYVVVDFVVIFIIDEDLSFQLVLIGGVEVIGLAHRRVGAAGRMPGSQHPVGLIGTASIAGALYEDDSEVEFE